MKIKILFSFILTIITGIGFFYPVTVLSQSIQASSHFIVVIRDTGYMKRRQGLTKIRKTLPSLLFDNKLSMIDKQKRRTQKSRTNLANLPQYNPSHDYLSIVFASIDKNTGCKASAKFSAKSEHFFQWQPVVQNQNKVVFEKALRKWLTNSCRAKGHTFSSVLAETMILPYVQQQLEKQGDGNLLFAKTILIIVDNDTTFGGVSPSKELATLAKKGVADIDWATKAIDKFTQAFRFVGSENWVFTINNNRGRFLSGALPGDTHLIRYRISELAPSNVNEHFLIDAKKEFRLDRLAVSNNRLDLIPDIPLRILPSKQVRPFELTLAFENALNGGVWRVGDYEFPTKANPKTITIQACSNTSNSPCYSQQNGLNIFSLLKLVHNDVHLNANDPNISEGKLFFAVKFLYEAGSLENGSAIYSHHYLDTLDKGWKTINLIPEPPKTVPAESYDNTLVFPEIYLDNQGLTGQYTQKDTPGLSQNDVIKRIKAKNETLKGIYDAGKGMRVFKLIFLVIVIVIFFWIIWLLYANYKGFKPRLKWIPAKEISLDFNQQPGAKLLVGTLIVENETRFPKLNKQAEFSLQYDDLTTKGFELENGEPLGFVDTKHNNKLALKQSQLVAHNMPVQVFFTTDTIKDFKVETSIVAEKSVFFTGGKNISISAQMQYEHWGKHQIEEKIPFELKLIPERPQPPLVTYQQGKEDCIFSAVPGEEQRAIGEFIFHSQAKHQFAADFVGEFFLVGYDHYKLPLPKNTLLLEGGNLVTVPAYKNSELSKTAIIICDNDIIQNPPIDPGNVNYTFELKGFFDQNSQSGPHRFALYRDPRQADLYLDISQGRNTHRIFWKTEESSHPLVKKARDEEFAPEGESLLGEILKLDPYLVEFSETSSLKKLFAIKFINDGFSNDEVLQATVKAELAIDSSVKNDIILDSDYQFEELIHFKIGSVSGVQSETNIQVKERQQPKKLIISLDTRHLQDIKIGRVGTNENLTAHPLDISRHTSSDKRYSINGKILLNVSLEIKFGEEGKQPRRQHSFRIKIPLGLEKAPHHNWLCVDYGTSAIVAAIGMEYDEEPILLTLQNLEKENNPALNFADYNENIEKGTPFLPSYVACDADLRQGQKKNDIIRKGYPRYQPASLEVGEPDFISLPATSLRLGNNPSRIIFSLKSWLAQPEEKIRLDDEIKFEEKGKSFNRRDLPLDKVIISGYAALAEGYIAYFEEFKKGGQIVLSYPNTFTIFHQRKLHDIAWKALKEPLGINLPERIRLISESDAVAFSYCQQRRLNKEHVTKERERLLVYDFGAGTLDLSLISINWGQEENYPETWQVENRLGVPIAGNYLDSLLARLIDDLLRDLLTNNDTFKEIFEYRYPLVGRKFKGEKAEQNSHRQSIHQLWGEIRFAKQGNEIQHQAAWDGEGYFQIKVGELGEIRTVMTISSDTIDADKTRLDSIDTENEAFINIREDNSFWLNIPAAMVHNYKPLANFIEFVTNTIINEVLDVAGLGSDNIEEKQSSVNTLVISGRGALWPGIHEKVINHFDNLDITPKKGDSQQVKNAVVRGALAWQKLADFVEIKEPKCQSQLAVLCMPGQRLIPESEWKNGNEVDLKGTSYFQLMEVGIKNPQQEDLNSKSLRHHFYAVLDEFKVAPLWLNDRKLFIKQDVEDGIEGQTVLVLSNSLGEEVNSSMVGAVGGITATERPWPIGNPLLKP
jgi:hypothetical protein